MTRPQKTTVRQRWISAILVGGVVLQLGLIFKTQWVKRVDFSVDKPLPFTFVGWDARKAPERARCQYGFIVSISCPACGRLVELYTGDVAPQLPPSAPRPWWFVDDDLPRARAWANERGLDPTKVVELEPRKGGLLARPTVGSVWFTPTRVVFALDRHRLRDIRPSDQFLSQNELEAYCDEGGVAINNPAEARQFVSDGRE